MGTLPSATSDLVTVGPVSSNDKCNFVKIESRDIRRSRVARGHPYAMYAAVVVESNSIIVIKAVAFEVGYATDATSFSATPKTHPRCFARWRATWNDRMAKLSTAERNALPTSSFAGPGRSYPIPNKSHAANAKARAHQQWNKGNLSYEQYKAIERKANAKLRG